MKSLRFTIALLCGLSAMNANACGWLGEMIGFCEIADASREAAEEVADATKEASDDLYSAVNFWGKIIEDYHTGDDEEQKNARLLIKKVFGTEDIDAAEPFVGTFQFSGFDTKDHPLRVAALSLKTPDPTAKIRAEDATSADFNFVSIVRSVPSEDVDYESYDKNTEELRTDVTQSVNDAVNRLIKNYTGGHRPNRRIDKASDLVLRAQTGHDGSAGCTDITKPKIVRNGVTFDCSDPNDKATRRRSTLGSPNHAGTLIKEWTNNRQAADSLIEAILSVVDTKLHLRGARETFTIPYTGQEYIALVIPVVDLENHPTLDVKFTIHLKGNPLRTLPIYEKNAADISWNRLDKSKEYSSTNPDHGGRYKAHVMQIVY